MTLFSENSSIVIQHSWATAQLWNNSDEAAQVRWPKCSGASVNSSSWGNTLRWKFNVSYTETEVKLAYVEKNAYPQSLIGPLVHAIQMRAPNHHSWGGTNSTTLIGHNGAALIGQQRYKWGYTTQLWLDRESLRSLGWISILGALLYKGWLRMQKHSAQAVNSPCGFSLICSLHDRPLP